MNVGSIDVTWISVTCVITDVTWIGVSDSGRDRGKGYVDRIDVTCG